MNFVELSKEEYSAFWENHPLKTFLSSVEVGDLRSKNNWSVSYVGVKSDGKILAATMLLSKLRHFSSYEFYAPRGYLIDFNNNELVNFFTNELKKYVKNHKGFILRIDPYVIYKQRDIDGNIVENGIDNSKVVENLEELGFKKVSKEKREQVGWMFSLDLENKTEEDILKEMRQNTRNTIRKTEKIGIDVEEVKYEDLDKFYNIMIETGKRKDFSIRDISYYQEMYKLFYDKGQIKYFITSLNLKKYCEKLNKEKEEKKNKLLSMQHSKKKGEIKTIEEDIKTIDKRITEAKQIMKDTSKDVIELSGSMFILIHPEIVYLSSGNYEEYLKFNSQYLIQWELIKYGLKNGFKKHNFYGIPDDINTHPKDYGIYKFKKGFNGYVEELIGEFELPISGIYYINKIVQKIKR